MIPAGFDYKRPASLEEAQALLAEHSENASVLAGGHSLLMNMKLRLTAPKLLIDISRLHELDYIRIDGDEVAIGAATRYHDLVTSELLASECALLPAAARTVGDPQVRHRGTLGGTIAYGHPRADLPTAVLTCDGTVILHGPRGRRAIPIAEFYTGDRESLREPDELITEIRVVRTGDTGWAYEKFSRRANDWATVAAAVVTGPDGARRVGLVNMARTPWRARATEAALTEGRSLDQAAAMADVASAPPSDHAATPEYRRHLARVLTRRALLRAAGVSPI
uniref:FAD binding domain-containing protein n=1 Tax=Nonomuraea bangladeshensis TaxID=404385 RepID=UPI003F493093